MGASLAWLSVFPAEHEVVFPPGTVLSALFRQNIKHLPPGAEAAVVTVVPNPGDMPASPGPLESGSRRHSSFLRRRDASFSSTPGESEAIQSRPSSSELVSSPPTISALNPSRRSVRAPAPRTRSSSLPRLGPSAHAPSADDPGSPSDAGPSVWSAALAVPGPQLPQGTSSQSSSDEGWHTIPEGEA
jgi:hypothetical protein